MNAETFDLRALASSNERMVQIFRWLDGLQGTRNTARGMDIRVQDNGIAVEQFVEADVVDGFGVCFWLETRLDDHGCIVEASLLHQTPTGQETFREAALSVDERSDYATAVLSMTDALWRWREDGFERAAQGTALR
jgi:hypothetical protein